MDSIHQVNNFSDLYDLFKESDYPKDADGFTQVPPSAIYQTLRSYFPHGYEEDVHEGFYPDGRPYVRIKLTVSDPAGGPFKASVYGYAEAPLGSTMSFAGLLTMARRQACLRGLGMGDSLYKDERPEATVAPILPAIAPRTVSSTVAAAPTYRPAPTTRPSYPPRSGGSGGFSKPWDGTVKVKSPTSPHFGKMWKDIPIEAIQKMASGPSPVSVAVMELKRREAEYEAMYGAAATAVEEAMDSRIDTAVDAVREAPPGSAGTTLSDTPFRFRH